MDEVQILHMGPGFILVKISLDFVGHVTATEVEHTIVAIDQEIKARNTLVKRVFIEAESRQSFV